ncbi:hypothetical protein EMIT051CA3_80231 [Pseudomonas chlororaphis]
MGRLPGGLFARLEDHELGRGGHLLDATEQPRQLAVVAQVTVADDVQRAAHHQGLAGLLEHAPGEEIADHLLLMKGRVAQHHVQRLRLLAGQAVAGAHGHFALAQGRAPVLQGRLHGHEGFVHQGVVGVWVVQGAGDGQYAVAAPQVRDPGLAEVFRQVREEGAGADVQAFAAEHIGVVEQLDGGLVECVAGRVGRNRRGFRLRRGDQQTGFLHRQRGLYRADIALQQIAGGPWQVLDHRRRHHLGARGQLALQADQLFFQQGQGLGHADQNAVEWPGQRLAGRHHRDGVEWQAIAHQVFLQRQRAEKRVAAAAHLHAPDQAGRQRAEAVVEDQHPGVRRRLLFGQVIEQVLVRRVESLQGLVLLFGLADQVELGEGAFEQGHGADSW